MDTINLCMFTAEFIPVWGGTGSYVIELVKKLPANVNIHIVTLRRILPNGTGKHDSQSVSSIINRPIHVHYISQTKETFFYNPFFQAACLTRFPLLHKKYRFDIIHSHLPHMPDVYLKLFNRHFSRFPTVLTVHGTIQQLRDDAVLAKSLFGEADSSENNSVRFYPLIHLLQQNYVRRISRLIAVSKFTKGACIDHLGLEENKIQVIYNGVDTRIFHPPSEAEKAEKYSKPTVLYVGRLVAKKGVNNLIGAMPQVLKVFPRAQFVFAGSGNIDLHRKTIDRLGIPKKNFLFTGQLNYFSRPDLLRKSTVFVVPSMYENCSLSILEAMSSEAAVVATSSGGNLEVIESGKNGILAPFKKEKLGESIISLLKDENYNRNVAAEARKTVLSRFTSEICAKQTFDLYHRIVG